MHFGVNMFVLYQFARPVSALIPLWARTVDSLWQLGKSCHWEWAFRGAVLVRGLSSLPCTSQEQSRAAAAL